MAEFSELVRIKKRICIKYKSSGCIGCPIECGSRNLCGIISISGYSDNKFMELEEALLSWAAEHPEPVYPTWAQYFNKIIISNGRKPLLTDTELLKVVCTPIPADLAQKIGIEPKEG